MFGFKKKKTLEETISRYMAKPYRSLGEGITLTDAFTGKDFKLDKHCGTKETEDKQPIPCETCKCLINKSDAYEVATNQYGSGTLYYCQTHKPSYSKVEYALTVSSIHAYYKELQVTEDGTPVGYKKVK